MNRPADRSRLAISPASPSAASRAGSRQTSAAGRPSRGSDRACSPDQGPRCPQSSTSALVTPPNKKLLHNLHPSLLAPPALDSQHVGHSASSILFQAAEAPVQKRLDRARPAAVSCPTVLLRMTSAGSPPARYQTRRTNPASRRMSHCSWLIPAKRKSSSNVACLRIAVPSQIEYPDTPRSHSPCARSRLAQLHRESGF